MFLEDSIGADLEAVAKDCGQQARLEELIDSLELRPLLAKHAQDVSRGQLQRAALAMCLASGAKLLLLDEPTKGLDEAAKRALAGIVRQACEQGYGVLMVTHDLEFVASYADTCSMLFDGQCIATAPAHSFFLQNQYYTTAMHRMTRGLLEGCVTLEELSIEE